MFMSCIVTAEGLIERFCFDFRYESNGIVVCARGWFFSSDNFDFLLAIFDGCF